MASTNLLWIQERFDPKSESLPQVLEIAGKWNAAVEVVRLAVGEEIPAFALTEATAGSDAGSMKAGGVSVATCSRAARCSACA